jgi:2,3-bisphosphoglycerate-dependent phosphoglycerate mutase
VLLRHGESEWNATKRFSGWTDIDLTEKGRNQATQAGKLLSLHGFEFDEAHASVLKRAVRTLWTALHSSNHHWIPVQHTWRLNERHYGALTGLSKEDAKKELGEEMLQKYRRGCK